MRILIILIFLTGALSGQENKIENNSEKKEVLKKEELQETLFIKSLDLLEEITAIVESADDKESTAEAVKKILKLSQKAEMIKKACEAAGLDNLTLKQQRQLTAKHKVRIHSVSLRLLNAIQLAKGKKELSSALKQIIEKM